MFDILHENFKQRPHTFVTFKFSLDLYMALGCFLDLDPSSLLSESFI